MYKHQNIDLHRCVSCFFFGQKRKSLRSRLINSANRHKYDGESGGTKNTHTNDRKRKERNRTWYDNTNNNINICCQGTKTRRPQEMRNMSIPNTPAASSKQHAGNKHRSTTTTRRGRTHDKTQASLQKKHRTDSCCGVMMALALSSSSP